MDFFNNGKEAKREKWVEIINKIKKHRATYRRKPKPATLRLCEKLISDNWMYLDEPREFANTVANICYSFCELAVLMNLAATGNITDSELLKELGLEGIENDLSISVNELLTKYYVDINVEYKSLDGTINNLRQIQAEYGRDSDVYKSALAFAIATTKYNINPKDAWFGKTKAIQIQLEKNVVDEIPDLIDALDI